jgi:hypothetical protein
MNAPIWPGLPLDAWRDTYATLHMWLQIVGKLRLRLSPFVNHWWNVALYVSPRGLRTSPMPRGAEGTFEIELDFLADELVVTTDDGRRRAMPLEPRTVADFYRTLQALLRSLAIDVEIDREPKEVPDPIPFDEDRTHASYDGEPVRRLHRILVESERVLEEFRGRFVGKCSPVHFFWGSFDLCVTRFSGRRAPERPEADHITRVAYSHEVSSVGFWPGSGNVLEPAFYAYAAPEPAGYERSRVSPAAAFYNPGTKGFILRYEDVRRALDPRAAILDFCESTHAAAATLGNWDRAALERRPAPGRRAA